jgi:hypothetical protein
MAGRPDLQFQIKNPFKTPGSQKTWWAPVGDISLWKNEQGVWSGSCRIFAFGTEFKVFEKEPYPGPKQQALGTTRVDATRGDESIDPPF